jgi:hypothetical protein
MQAEKHSSKSKLILCLTVFSFIIKPKERGSPKLQAVQEVLMTKETEQKE